MKKILLTLVALVALSSGVQGQGLLKGLKDKAKQKITNKIIGKKGDDVINKVNQKVDDLEQSVDRKLGIENSDGSAVPYQGGVNDGTLLRQDSSDGPQLFGEPASLNESSSASDADDKPVVPQATDVVPRRRTSTVTWDGTITPSKATTASALMAELPPLPAPEKMARSTMEERDAYNMKIAAVTARVEELQFGDGSCSDEELEAYRKSIEKRIQSTFGLTDAEMAKLEDPNVSDAEKEAIQKKMLQNLYGFSDDFQKKFDKFGEMTTEQQVEYMQKHPEFVEELTKATEHAAAMTEKARTVVGGVETMEKELAQLAKRLVEQEQTELSHSYDAIGAKYKDKLQAIYKQIFATSDQAKVDALYDEADKLLYEYRLEAAREYRASLQRRIGNSKTYTSEYTRIVQTAIDKGDVPKCILGRADLNTVTFVANVLQEAYANLPELDAAPVQETTLYTLPKGYVFASWENRGYVEVGNGFTLSGPNGISGQFPLLASGPDGAAAVVENGKFRKISQAELDKLNRQASDRNYRKAKNLPTPPYGTYKSRSGKRVVEYSKSGELIINSMTTYCPVAFKAQSDRLEWVVIDGDKIIKCLYKL